MGPRGLAAKEKSRTHGGGQRIEDNRRHQRIDDDLQPGLLYPPVLGRLERQCQLDFGQKRSGIGVSMHKRGTSVNKGLSQENGAPAPRLG